MTRGNSAGAFRAAKPAVGFALALALIGAAAAATGVTFGSSQDPSTRYW
jgi:hypothetical protein